MSERAGRGKVRVKPHLLDQYRPIHKPCSPLREHSLGAGHTGPPLQRSLAVLRAFLRALQVGLTKSLQEGLPASGLSGSQTRPKMEKRMALSLPGFHHPLQPLPPLTRSPGFQAKPLQTAPSDSAGATKAPPISFNKQMAMIGTLAGWPLGLPGLP